LKLIFDKFLLTSRASKMLVSFFFPQYFQFWYF